MNKDALRSQLDYMKGELKDKIKKCRQNIREEEELNEDYGIAAEDKLNDVLKNAIFAKGRTRRRVEETRAMDSRINSSLIEALEKKNGSDLNAIAAASCNSNFSVGDTRVHTDVAAKGTKGGARGRRPPPVDLDGQKRAEPSNKKHSVKVKTVGQSSNILH